MWELIFILLVIVYLSLPFLLRAKFPNKLWLAVILGFLNPVGQFYVRKNAIWYFLGLVLFGTITFSLIFFKFDYLSTNYNPITLMSIPGAVMNFLRLRNEMGKVS